MEFYGSVYQPKRNAFALIFWPIIQIKNLFQVIYQYILHIIWSELVIGKKVENELISLILFVIFCIISLLIYYFQQYSQILLIMLLIVWYIDRHLAHSQYFNNKHQLKVSLKTDEDDNLIWEMNIPDQTNNQVKIERQQLQQILITSNQIKAGAFEEVIGLVWQIELITTEKEHFLLDEKPDILTGLKSAEILANELNLPILFKNSEGNNQYTETLLNREEFEYRNLWPKTIILKHNQTKYHLASQWSWSNSWQLLREIFDKAGFLLFLIIMTNFMRYFGELVYFFVGGFLGIMIEIVAIPNDTEWLNINVNLVIPVTIAVLLMIFQGWQISRKKHIYLDKYYLKYYIDNQKIGQLKLAQIKACLLITEPEYNIFILTDQEYLRIGKLHREEDYRAMLVGIDQGLNELKNN
jgi:hypothetical protein